MLFSNGWFCITTPLFIKISFRPHTAGWYVWQMAKLSFESFFFVGGPTFYPQSGLLLATSQWNYKDICALWGRVWSLRGTLQKWFVRSLSLGVLLLCLWSNLFYTKRVAGGIIRVLEGFCRLVVGLDVKDRVILKSIPFVYYCVKESNILWN